MADQNTPLQTRSNMGAAIETSLAAIFATPGVAAALGLVSSVRAAVVSGAAAGNVTVAGIAASDTLVLVMRFIGAGVAVTDVAGITSEFSVTAANTINNTGGTNTTGDKLLVVWRG